MTAISTSRANGGRAVHGPGRVFGSILNAAVGMAVAKLEQKVAGWTDKVDDVADEAESSGALVELADEGLEALADEGGAARKAGVKAVEAGIHGENPILAGIKGAWQAGTPVMRAVIITAAVSALLLLLLSPVLLLVFLLSLLVIAAVQQARGPHEAET
jgi:hypothetical protein